MNRLEEFLRKLKREENSLSGLAMRRRRSRHSDPAKGLEYNEINGNYAVSKKIWGVDIARTPQVIKDIGQHIDVHGEAWKVNQDNMMINYRAGRVHGRGR